MGNPSADRYLPINDYAIVGDCHSAALIARDGSVDWFCPGRFDAPAVFCRLLDAEQGGYLRTAPVGSFSIDRRYSGPTNVLETTFTEPRQRVRLTDLMPVYQRTLDGRGYDVAARIACCAGSRPLRAPSRLRFSSNPLLTMPARRRRSSRAPAAVRSPELTVAT
ncbi:MAG: DUF5911 domain-containing protein [Chloroflexota bacterium]|nr:DUF5911 domain-containing protein [Chloroflexota bacterium]